MNHDLRTLGWLGGFTLIALGGCAQQPGPTASTLTGTIAQESFSSPVKKITITDDKGTSTSAAVGAHGEFSIELEQGASYSFLLAEDGKSTPIILNSEGGKLATFVRVTSGGATVDIGSVRFWAGESATQTNVIATPTTSAKCVNGVVSGSSKPCAGTAAVVSCAAGDDDDDNHHGGHHGGCPGMGDGEGAVDQKLIDPTGASKAAINADATKAMGVPEHNAPSSIGCAMEHHGHHGHHGGEH